ncbi:MAG TPA: bifunctional (p)ppGpp synthetase/guanosine-3',5'-bis(diphosphate) 3'-pyrophosphohydrolase [Myxococcota bacterium]|nr:bifunctional (p)ppGpp synthetase/guanosine-3',5'-bis(diphosphate) 3'-pyrophosphohydrolase [Myxococcota bacterium]HON25224.1 bifunctional (p)ppGpp synthetase/guanosine-3',5'-bis(diphosphate) 3'-pyrophosphohydrolase [Myxococcota bacterium]HOS62357.1 bifunctional (p)ppGpp synthetase/guanosine-3',5'-bis(diphosphate) 3'-pyrophosphohydrolase [Myxococcota bacterium]HPC92002.1 bifunctional (p)ppGpp synthetase/guanosine-3',5'-bis(diphosphate) 3'-pyrophosphohydrolase [Myxococcota bacterium]HPL24280.1 
MYSIDNILEKAREYMPDVDLEPVRAAAEYAAKVHEGQFRHSGTPYIMHPLAVADLVATLKLDVASLSAALLHDVIHVAPERSEELEQLFGSQVAKIVQGVTKLDKFQFTSKQEKQAENFKKMLIAMSKDIRVLLVKLCDRLHNMRELEFQSLERQQEISEETLNIYAPLAERLGISWVRTELEDLAFRHLWPAEYASVKEQSERRLKERADFIKDVIETIQKTLETNKLTGFEVFGRPKNLYGIFKKMKIQGIDLDRVYDFVAFRVICRDVSDCWLILGYLHNIWTPIPARFKDFINLPKPNGYRSLHSTVFGPQNEPMEIQIRTWQMHKVAESGIAAHWSYKEGGAANREQEHFNWLKQLIEWAQEVKSPDQFMEAVQTSLFVDEVFAFTPKGDLVVVPKGATTLDFAYGIHTEVGNSCTGAKVNNRLVPLSTKLRSGDLVEIMTSKNSRPKRDWLGFATTTRAQSKIRQYLQNEERKLALDRGRQILEKEFRRHGFSIKKVLNGGEDEKKILDAMRVGNIEDLYRAVSSEKILPLDVVKVLRPDATPTEDTALEEERRAIHMARLMKKQHQGIVVDGLEDVMLKIGRCCNPIPGDPIKAFITRGRGVTIHTSRCPTLNASAKERVLPAHWVQGAGGVFDVPLFIMARDEQGVLAAITKEISERKSNISSILTKPVGDGSAEIKMVLQVEDQSKLDGIIGALERIKGVSAVERIRQFG